MAVATALLTPSVAPPAHRKGVYRPDIDGLRAIAIISVIAFHARVALCSGGFVGVDVFLVISGYLIGSLVYREVREGRFSFLHFYERRAKRILPALLSVLLVCNVLAFVLLSPLELRDYCAQSFSAVASSSNIFYWLRSNYFNPVTALKPLLMTWSLGIEEQFYLLFPLTLVLLHTRAKRYVFAVVGGTCAVSFILCVACVNMYPAAAFYLLPMRAWEFGLGVLIAVREVQQDGPVQLSAAAANVVAWLGLAMIIAPVLVYSEGTRFPGFAALLPTAGASCLINSRDSFINRRLLASRPMVFIGLVSYSWYLWHWPLLSFARIVCGGLISVPRAVGIALASLALAIGSYYWIEQPFRSSTTATGRIFAGYAIVLIVLGAIPLIGYSRAGWPDRVPELVQVEKTVRQTENNICLAGYDVSTPQLKAPCLVESAGPKLALLGDSHAAALGTAMRQLAIGHGYGFEELTKAACPPLPSAPFHWAQRPTFEATCSSFNRAVFQQMMTDRSITIIVLAGSWSSLCSDGNNQDCYLNNPRPEKEKLGPAGYRNLYAGLLETISLLRSSGKHVFVVTDVPTFALDPMSIVRNSVMRSRGELASLLSPQVFSFGAVEESSLITPADRVTDFEVRQAASEGGAQIIDLARNLCPGSRCRFVDNGILLYADSNHLTPAGAEYALRGQDPLSEIQTRPSPKKE
jgi:peptidoglycan/LPS O-acetylase OafA/YrhL